MSIPLFKEFETQGEYTRAMESVIKNTPKKHQGELSIFIGQLCETLRQQFSQQTKTRKETK